MLFASISHAAIIPQMIDVHSQAQRDLGLLLVADLMLDPLGDGLSEAELRSAALEFGTSAPVIDEIFQTFWLERVKSRAGARIRASSMDLTHVSVSSSGHGYPPPFPMRTVANLADVFTRLERRLGVRTPKSFSQIVEESSEDTTDLARALGFLLICNRLQRTGDGFVRTMSTDGMGETDPQHRETARLKKAMTITNAIRAARTDSLAPQLPPAESFHLFLKKQGWSGLAGWWSETSQELKALWEYHPMSATVLAGALLECALVASAQPAKAAGQWRQKFLDDDPRTWQLGDLIKQAESAGTFSAADAAHAKTIADLRNRIHTGRFATSGPDPFRPPRTNRHEAQICKLHLDLLLSRLLAWKPIADLL
jgi:hypothetical protein